MRHSANIGRICAVLAVAFLARVGAAVGVQRIVDATPGRLCLISGDAEGYWELARKIRHGEEYSLYEPPRRILRMPGFSLVLAATQTLFGENVLATRVTLALVGTLACALTWLLARMLVDDTAALFAAIGCAISPTFIMFSVMMLSETLFALTLIASLIAIVLVWQACARESVNTERSVFTLLGKGLVCGVLVGIATYVRPTWIVAGPLAALAVLACRSANLSKRFLGATSILLGLAVIMAPWTYRNWQVSGHFIPTTLWMGASLYDGLHPQATGDSDMTFFDREQLGLTMSEFDVDQTYRRRAFEFLRSNPRRAVELAVIKQARYWSPLPNAAQFQRPAIQGPMLIFWLMLMVPAVVAAWQQRGNWLLLAVTLGPLLYFAALHTLFVGSIRYRLPAEYVVWILAGLGVAQLLKGFNQPRSDSPRTQHYPAEVPPCT